MSRNRNFLDSENGSGVVGFVLIAPLLVAVFIAIGQIAMLVADKSVLNSAAAIGARTAGAADASNEEGRNAALKVLASHGFESNSNSILISQELTQGVTYVLVSVSQVMEIPYLGQKIEITGNARAIDEASL